MKGPLATDGFRFSLDFKMASGAMLAKWCFGRGAKSPSVHIARNGAKGLFRWKVMLSLSEEISAEVIKLKPVVLAAPNLALFQSFQVKSTSSAFRGCPSDHFKPGLSLNVQVFKSALISPLAAVGSSVTILG